MPSGDPVCNFNVATMKGDKVEWHRLVAYDKNADKAKRDFDTGDLVYIEGAIQTREMLSTQDQAAGRKPRKITEIIVSALHLVEKKGSSAAQSDAIKAEPKEPMEQVFQNSSESAAEQDLPNKLPGWVI